MQIIPFDNYEKTVRHYVCAVCWGPLIAKAIKGDRDNMQVGCAKPDCSGEGFVTRQFADRARNESKVDLVEARITLRDALNLPKSSKADLAKSLGFE